MAFRLPNNVLQLSTTAGTGAYSFTGVVSGYAAFSTQLANGDTVPYFARDATSWEVGLGTWASAGSTLTRVLIASSSGGLISWPGTGSREVGCGLPGTWLLQLLDPSAAAGFVARGTTLGTWAMRTFANGSFISVDNPAGTAGNPTINDAALATTYFPRKDTGTSTINAIWTFAQRLIFGGFSGSPSVHELRGQSDELMWRWRRDGANEYDAEVRQSSSWRRVITATASDVNDADTLAGQNLVQVRGPNYTSPDQTITSGGSLSLSHGLVGVPSLVQCFLICQTAQFGYTAGEIIAIGSGSDVAGVNSTNRAHTMRLTASTIQVQFGAAAALYNLNRLDATAGETVLLTNINWKIRFLAWI